MASASDKTALAGGPAAWLRGLRDGARSNLALAGRAGTCALAASLPDAPGALRAAAAADARGHAATLMRTALYGGDGARMDADLRFYGDGFALLARDLSRDGGLLLATQPLTPREAAARARVLADVRALLPFSLLLMNTFPFTHAMLTPLVTPGKLWVLPAVPRRWLHPSAFDPERLGVVARARRLAARAAAPSSPTGGR